MRPIIATTHYVAILAAVLFRSIPGEPAAVARQDLEKLVEGLLVE